MPYMPGYMPGYTVGYTVGYSVACMLAIERADALGTSGNTPRYPNLKLDPHPSHSTSDQLGLS